MVLNLTKAEAVVLNEVLQQETRRYIYLGKHTSLAKLRRKVKQLIRTAAHKG